MVLGAQTLGRRSRRDTGSCWLLHETVAVGGVTLVASLSSTGHPFLSWGSHFCGSSQLSVCGLSVMVAESLVLWDVLRNTKDGHVTPWRPCGQVLPMKYFAVFPACEPGTLMRNVLVHWTCFCPFSSSWGYQSSPYYCFCRLGAAQKLSAFL